MFFLKFVSYAVDAVFFLQVAPRNTELHEKRFRSWLKIFENI